MTKRNHITEQELIEITNRKSLENAIERFSSSFEEVPMRTVEPPKNRKFPKWAEVILTIIGIIAFICLLGRMEYLAYWC